MGTVDGSVEGKRRRRVTPLVVAITLMLSWAACCGSGAYFVYHEIGKGNVPPEGPSASAGNVRITVHAVERVDKDSVRVTASVQNTRPPWALDEEFYLGEFSLDEIGGPQGDQDYQIEFKEGQQDYVGAGGYQTYSILFKGVPGEPAALVYTSPDTGSLTVDLPPPKQSE